LIRAAAQDIESRVHQSLRIREFCGLLQVSLPESITSLSQLLDNEDELADIVRSNHLDGVASQPVNIQQREEYFAAIRTHIPENVALAVFPPPDLGYLCTLASGITGLGISYSHEAQQIEFLSPIEEH
jgi:hypothetical protein